MKQVGLAGGLLKNPDNQLDNDGNIQFGIDGDLYPNTELPIRKNS